MGVIYRIVSMGCFGLTVFVCVCVCVCARAHVWVHMCVCVCVCMHACIIWMFLAVSSSFPEVCVYMCIYVCIFIYLFTITKVSKQSTIVLHTFRSQAT